MLTVVVTLILVCHTGKDKTNVETMLAEKGEQVDNR